MQNYMIGRHAVREILSAANTSSGYTFWLTSVTGGSGQGWVVMPDPQVSVIGDRVVALKSNPRGCTRFVKTGLHVMSVADSD